MKIKKLELVGFKSFVDRTVLHFEHDVLGIVGPNGCGKSNIVDAIRWCMGEQSARHLRGRSMEDVIFNGSESRSAHDFAEVTLTFDNDAAGELPLEYQEYAEIAVTRRLHRSGESEYLVNKTPVRLRDVTDLFLGTGAGTKAYSIVEQGKIGLIVSAKAEDRRLLIEEAAGITKFKSRKKQAERKMELTAQNLLRVGDIVAEIDRNLASLKRQAAKAERYVAYREELEDLQLHEAAHRYLELDGWLKLEGGEVERLTELSEKARGELAARDAEVEAVRHEVHASEELLDGAQNASFAADSAVRAEEAAIERAKDRLASLRQREQQAAGEQREMVEQLSRLCVERDVVDRDVVSLREDEAAQAERGAEEEAKLADHGRTHAAADDRLKALRATIASARAELASAEAKLSGFDRRRAELVTRRDKVAIERESLGAARVEHAARADEYGRSIEDLRSGRVTTADAKTQLEQRLIELKARMQSEERALEDCKGILSQKRSRHDALEEMHSRLDGAKAGTKALVAMRDPCVLGLVADRLEAPPELTQALAGLLGAKLEDVVVDDIDGGQVLLEKLALEQKGRATIVPRHPPYVAGVRASLPEDGAIVTVLADAVRSAPGDEALVHALVGDAVVVRDLAAAGRLRSAGVRSAIVTLDGAVLHADGRIAGGQGDELAAGMLESKREARELAIEIGRLAGLATRHFDALQATRGDLARTGTALDQARHEAHEREIGLLTVEKDLQNTESQLTAVLKRLEALTSEEQDLAVALDEAAFEHAEAARILSETGATVEQAEGELVRAEAALVGARDLVDAQRLIATACKVTIAGTRERLAAAVGTQARLARSVEELQQRASRLDEELVENARTFGHTAAELVGHREEVSAALDRASSARDELGRARAAFEERRGQLLEREGLLKEVRARVDAVRDDLAAHEMARREKEIALDHLLAGVAEKFRGLCLPRVVGDYHMRPPTDEVTRGRIDELSRLIERMGSVNLDAMREHAEAEERFTFYTTQKADLESALSDLQRAIHQMNRESRRLFQETFDAVNARFKEVFPRMFRGGRAELRMTNPDDLLETGIDIVAQPPGKKLSSIELMSGGEKALTAVSLIFAIFQIKPSPFCILDEVDAPLDEANVMRYNDLVRSMTDRSQFILITHVKRTMQTVDVLYGVTMPEPGVSKIVGVKISEKAERRAPHGQVEAAVA
jgi:chromosome segregation protein